MLRVFILLGLATAVAPDPDCQGVECVQKFVESLQVLVQEVVLHSPWRYRR